MLKRYTNHKFLIWSLAIAAIMYSLVSVVNHYCFRTYSLDLGLYTNALYDYAHFQWNDSSVFKENSENLLADHFDLYLLILSPLSFIFGSYTLLIIQIISLLFGAVGVYRLFENSRLRYFALLYFLFFFAIFSALSFDYHSNVVATMFVPWLFLAFQNKKWRQAWLILILILIAKENMSLWMVFLTLGIAWLNRKDKTKMKQAILMSGISLLYFVLVFGLLMPLLSTTGKYHHFQYGVLGSNAREAVVYLVSHPIESLRLLFVNHNRDPLYDYFKTELWIFIFGLGFLLLRKPIYIFMLLPIFAQKLYHINPALWSINGHYAIEFAPILTIGVFDVLRTFKSEKLQTYFASFMVFLSIGFTFRMMDDPNGYTEKARLRIYKKAHYNREFSISEAHRVIQMIPKNAVVSAQSAFVPHLALRDSVFTFPSVRNVEYVLFSPIENPYPISQENFDQLTTSLCNSSDWEKVYFTNELVLLKRKK